jgi:hypothetical protein
VHPKPWQYTMPELHATHHDMVDTKVQLLLAARASGDTALALSLTTSLIRCARSRAGQSAGKAYHYQHSMDHTAPVAEWQCCSTCTR